MAFDAFCIEIGPVTITKLRAQGRKIKRREERPYIIDIIIFTEILHDDGRHIEITSAHLSDCQRRDFGVMGTSFGLLC